LKRLEDILDWLRNFLLPSSNDNLKVVVLCVLAATTFWFFNALNGNYNYRINYPLVINYPDSTHIVVEPLPKYIDIEVNSGGWNLLKRSLWFTNDPVTITLENPHNTSYMLAASLQTALLEALNEIKLNRILTDTLKIQIDKRVEKTIRLVIDSADFNMADNYRIISPIQLSTDTIVLKGPERFIRQIPKIFVLEMETESINSNFNERVKLPDFGSKLIQRQPEEVRVQFEVGRFVDTTIKLPYEKLGFAKKGYGWQPTDTLVAVTITHIDKKLKKNLTDSIRIQLDIKKFNKTDSTVMPQLLYVPAEIRQWEISPQPLKLRFQ
jgi:hypothetical protein